MMAQAGPDIENRSANALRLIGAITFVLLVVGAFSSESVQIFLAFAAIVLVAIAPAMLWFRRGNPGVPMLPAVSLAYIPYAAIPIISQVDILHQYLEDDVVQAALTVVLFLFIAAIVWYLVIPRSGKAGAQPKRKTDPSQIHRLIVFGLLLGLVYHTGNLYGGALFAGSFFGTIRAMFVTFTTVACFLAGAARGEGTLTGYSWRFVLVAIVGVILISWASLFLVGGLVYALAVFFGYATVARRLPWAFIAVIVATAAVLHAGKGAMREKYWVQGGNYSAPNIISLPILIPEWIGEGVVAIATGDTGQNVLDRASMMQMILLAENQTPRVIDFLKGETYALLPEILVPRFISENKPASQVAMDFLNVTYGILTVEGAQSTAVGWGLIAEAYANFGYWGVAGMAVLLGLFCGMMTRWSTNAETMSTASLASIATMMILINLEIDFIQLASALIQAFISVALFIGLYRWLVMRQQRASS